MEQRPIADRKGRSPSVQLNEPADELERFLRQHGQPVLLQRVVVLAHRRSRLGRAEVLRLIEHDHAFHDKRRRARSR